jgi:glycosyltransferase involved in cell wall biosynthesis
VKTDSAMNKKEKKIVMVGAFPPPVRGMPVVNAAVRNLLQNSGAQLVIINLAAPSVSRSMMSRIVRCLRVLSGLGRFIGARRLRGHVLYLSVSGGWGQVYEILFSILGRLHRMRLFLHHHSFAYLNGRKRLMTYLTHIAGSEATHITQSLGMAKHLQNLYGVRYVTAVSNAFFCLQQTTTFNEGRRNIRTLGFISNISAEKGIFEFLDLLAAVRDAGLSLEAKIAGPFQDRQTERRVYERLQGLPGAEYLGAKYGAEKDWFFSSIDVLVFPTKYENETEGIVNHEALSRGIPVIAYGRGCIGEIIGDDCGKVVDPCEPFVPAALGQIKAWLASPDSFTEASRAAARRFIALREENLFRWQNLQAQIIGASASVPSGCGV